MFHRVNTATYCVHSTIQLTGTISTASTTIDALRLQTSEMSSRWISYCEEVRATRSSKCHWYAHLVFLPKTEKKTLSWKKIICVRLSKNRATLEDIVNDVEMTDNVCCLSVVIAAFCFSKVRVKSFIRFYKGCSQKNVVTLYLQTLDVKTHWESTEKLQWNIKMQIKLLWMQKKTKKEWKSTSNSDVKKTIQTRPNK